jgi:hypothetical protein
MADVGTGIAISSWEVNFPTLPNKGEGRGTREFSTLVASVRR